MEWISLIILFLVVFVASIVQGISGFAFGILALLVVPYFYSYTQSVALVALMTVFLLVYNAIVYRAYINWSLAPVAILAFSVTDIAAVCLLKYIGKYEFIYALLGVIFILMAIYLLWMKDKMHIAGTTKNAVAFNGLAGILNGLFGAGGPIAAAYFLAVSKDKNEYIATVQAVFSVAMVIDLVVRAFNGMYTLQLIALAVICIVFMILGLVVAKKLFQKLSSAKVQVIVCILMLANGINLIVRSFV